MCSGCAPRLNLTEKVTIFKIQNAKLICFPGPVSGRCGRNGEGFLRAEPCLPSAEEECSLDPRGRLVPRPDGEDD